MTLLWRLFATDVDSPSALYDALDKMAAGQEDP